MAIRNDFAPGEVLAAADLNDTFGSKLDVSAYNPGMTLIHKEAMSAVSSVSINSVFSATYKLYKLFWTGFGSASASGLLRLRSSGADDTSSNYAFQQLNANSTSLSGFRGTSQTSLRIADFNTNYTGFEVLLSNPFLTERTSSTSIVPFYASGTVQNIELRVYAGSIDTATSYDGVTLLTGSGNITGTLLIFGLSEAI
jgi:hypothetical protein